MKYKILFAVLFAGALCASCAVKEENPAETSGQEIRFTASLGSFQVKATDTAFEEADAVGLSAADPVKAANVKLTWQGGSLVPETPVCWSTELGVDDPVRFYAYYPYQEGVDVRNGFEFSVNADQSTHALYTASDFLYAETEATPSYGSVHLNFTHLLSKVVLRIDNRLDGEIADVFFGNVYGRGYFRAGNTWPTYQGEPGTIKAGKVTLTDGSDAWALILMPQCVEPVLMITTTEGKQYTYQVPEAVFCYPGRRYNASIILDATSIATDFTSDVIDWVDDNDIQFGQEQPAPAWSLIGTLHGTAWDTDFPLDYLDSENCYITSFYYQTGQEFKLRANGSWTLNYGTNAGTVTPNIDFYGETDGGNIALPYTGYYTVRLYPDEDRIRISRGAISWSLLGLGGNWAEDSWMQVGFDGTSLYYEKVFEYNEGESFKIRAAADWAYNFGVEDDSAIPFGADVEAVRDGANIFLSESGTWKMRYYPHGYRLTFEKLQVQEASIPEVLAGADGDYFRVTGTVTHIINAYYGNYYLSDEEGNTLYIYGTRNSYGAYPGTNWQSFDIMLYDRLTVWGPKNTYGRIVELVDVQVAENGHSPLGISTETLSFVADGSTGALSLAARSEDSPVVEVSDSWIHVSEESPDGSYRPYQVTCDANEGEARTGEIHVRNSAVERVVTVSQDGH